MTVTLLKPDRTRNRLSPKLGHKPKDKETTGETVIQNSAALWVSCTEIEKYTEKDVEKLQFRKRQNLCHVSQTLMT